MSTSFNGPPDKPRNPLESLLVGTYILAAILTAGVVTGILWFALSALFSFIGVWLVVGLPLTILLVVLSGYTFRHIDHSDPYDARKTMNRVSNSGKAYGYLIRHRIRKFRERISSRIARSDSIDSNEDSTSRVERARDAVSSVDIPHPLGDGNTSNEQSDSTDE
jgi:hypothetical protein